MEGSVSAENSITTEQQNHREKAVSAWEGCVQASHKRHISVSVFNFIYRYLQGMPSHHTNERAGDIQDFPIHPLTGALSRGVLRPCEGPFLWSSPAKNVQISKTLWAEGVLEGEDAPRR